MPRPFHNTSKKSGFREWTDDKGEVWLAQHVGIGFRWNVYRRRGSDTTYLRTVEVLARPTPRNIQTAFETK